MAESTDNLRYCVVIPAYQEEGRIGPVVSKVLEYCRDVIVVDDGSQDRTAAEAEAAGAIVIRHETNRGKGMALESGFRAAAERGAEVVITLDGDGQHDPDDIPRFLAAYRRTGIPVLIGNRLAEPHSMPILRLWTNRFMSWLLSREIGQYVPDTQCGYRLYRADIIPFVSTESQRFAAESEILLNIAERNIRIDSVRIKPIYFREARSKINAVTDTGRFLAMLWRYHRKRRQLHKRDFSQGH